ncbi:hypothetical protein ACOSQ4_018129 [Xanthoceras sorbifolium]
MAGISNIGAACSTTCGVVVSPSCHHFKINTNASLDVHSVVEALAILKGRLQFTIESGLLSAVLKFDSLLAISATNGENVFLSEVGLIIHDVVELLRSNPGSSVIFVPRSIVVSDNQIPALPLSQFALPPSNSPPSPSWTAVESAAATTIGVEHWSRRDTFILSFIYFHFG